MNTLKSFFPLTKFGLVLLVTSIYLVNLNKQADIIATIIGSTCIFIIVFSFLVTFFNYLWLRRIFSLNIKAPHQSHRIYSNKNLALQLNIVNLRILPFIQVSLSIPFEHTKFKSPEIFLRKQQDLNYSTTLNITFPHRGTWQSNQVNAVVHDLLGICQLSWKLNIDSLNIPVLPPQVRPEVLPLVVSSFHPGDDTTSPLDPQGDYYDLKKYHPSDGAKKIVWKIYARTEELISRHPEPSASPSGEVMIYCAADPKNDFLARSCLNYVRQIEDYDLNVLFKCAGSHEEYATNYEEAEFMLLESVWSSTNVNSKYIVEDLNYLLSATGDRKTMKIAFFSGLNKNDLSSIEQSMLNQGIKLHFFTSEDLRKKNQTWLDQLFVETKGINPQLKLQYLNQ